MGTKKVAVCANCGRRNVLTIADLLRATGLPWNCEGCRCDLFDEKNCVGGEKGRSDSQKRSINQEKRVAKREGGKRQPASGALPGFEGDVRAPRRYRGECKFTRNRSYTLKLDDLEKLERQAYHDELPVFDLEFQGTTTKRYVILPEWVFDVLMEESGRRK